MGFVGSYVWKLRQVWGSQPLLVPGIGAFIMTPQGKLWLGKRTDSGQWSYFGGAVELGDSVMDTVIKEVFEETGIETVPEDWTFVGIHSLPKEMEFVYPNGNEVQALNSYFTMVLAGGIATGDDEHSEFAAFDLGDLPHDLKPDNLAAIAVFKAFMATGKVQVR